MNGGPSATSAAPALRRELGLFGAAMMGLGSIVGTGIFVSIGIAAGVAGPSVILAIAIAALLAVCNALSSAQLAASHPTSGGTYEYGYVYLRPWLGFAAGWMFLCAKSASAATAALGFAGYALASAGLPTPFWRTSLAAGAAIALTAIVLSGIRRSNFANIVIVSVTLTSLLLFIVGGMGEALRRGSENLAPFFASPGGDARPAAARLLEASALMFVAYTGYGRIATLGEEVREPRRTIPRAIILTLGASMLLYLGVGLVGIAAAGAAALGVAGTAEAAPLVVVARGFEMPAVGTVLSLGAITAMLGVLLNLILGLSRVALAMGRRGDLPAAFARLDARGATPTVAVIAIGGVVLLLVIFGSIKVAWSFSAFTVLIYYAITNLAAIRLPAPQRLYHPAIAWLGLAGCLGLAFWVEPRIWAIGLLILGAGLLGRRLLRVRPA